MNIPRVAAVALLTASVVAACGREPALETRTFALDNLPGGEAEALIRPYVYQDRPGAAGTYSAIDGAITVRETADNLDRIARVLDQYDAPRGPIQLRFRLVEAGDFPDGGELGGVREQLESLFPFPGYRIRGEAFVTVTDRSHIEQALSGMEGSVVQAGVSWLRPDLIRLHEVNLWASSGRLLTTSVNIRPGQTLVLGSGSPGHASGPLFLTVEAMGTPDAPGPEPSTR